MLAEAFVSDARFDVGGLHDAHADAPLRKLGAVGISHGLHGEPSEASVMQMYK